MTTIVAVQGDGDVMWAWDSMSVQGNEKSSLNIPKVFARGGVVYGVGGALRALDVLSTADFPDYDPDEDPRAWIITKWVPTMRDILVAEPAMYDMEEHHTNFGVIMVVDGVAFELDSNLSPLGSTEGIYTLGSGGDYARGALFAGVSPAEAVTIATQIDPFSGGVVYELSNSDILEGNYDKL